MMLDRVLAAYDRREIHRRKCADPVGALGAVRRVSPREIPGFRLLFGVRSALVLHRAGMSGSPLWDSGLAVGFRVLDETPTGVVAGAIGQFWRLRRGEWARFEGREGFLDFAEPGYVKAAISFWVDGPELMTETRVLGTDPISARRMARYWPVIRPGSGVIRRGWLRAADKRSAT